MSLLALAILFLPGLALAVHLEQEEADPISFLATAGLSAASVWILAFWLLNLLPLDLSQALAGVAGISALGLLLPWGKTLARLRRLRRGRGEGLALALMGGLALCRLLPLWLAHVAPGADMSMNSYMAQLILRADGVPPSYLPILPMEEFGTYAAGHPTLAALLSIISGQSAVASSLTVACLSHWFVTLAVYSFVRARFGPVASLAAATLVTFSAASPQSFFSWGGNPTVLALALVGQGLALIHRLDQRLPPGRLALAALLLAAAPATNAVMPYALFWVLPPVLLLRFIRVGGAQRRAMVTNGVVLVVLMATLLAPLLSRFQLVLSHAELQWIMEWQRSGSRIPPGPAWMLPWSLLPYMGQRLGLLTAWLAAALVARRWGRTGSISEELLLLTMTLALVLNAHVWLLPASYALYPERVVLLLIFPAARIIADTAEWLLPMMRGRRHWKMAWGVGALYVGSVLFGWGWHYLVDGLRDVSVTDDDLTVIRWIGDNTPPDAVIDNAYDDAGIWIPALVFRAVKNPHANIIYNDELNLWRKKLRPGYLFVGAKQVYNKERERHTIKALREHPGRYKRLFQRGAAVVYLMRKNGDSNHE